MTAQTAAGVTVLVVDDEPGICTALANYLTRSGHRPVVAASGEEALRLLRDAAPEIAFVDLRLPGMDGMTLMRRLRQERPEIRIVMITAFGDIDVAIEATQAGAFAYLPKPFDLDEVGRIVGKLVSAGPVAVTPEGDEEGPAEIVLRGGSEVAAELRVAIATAARRGAPALLVGDVGSGRESAARALRDPEGPFHAVHCSAASGDEIDAALAAAATDGPGTWFLADVENLSSREIDAILQGAPRGESRPRVVASTRRDRTALHERAGRRGWTVVHVPAIGERREDLAKLAGAILARVNREQGLGLTGIDAAALTCLESYAWPGNLRELDNVLRAAGVAARGQAISVDALPSSLRTKNGP